MDLLEVLRFDLKIETLTKIARRMPFEILAIRLCWLLHQSNSNKNAMNIIEVFKQISSKRYSARSFFQLFDDDYSRKTIFNLLSNKWDDWRKIIEYMRIEFIT